MDKSKIKRLADYAINECCDHSEDCYWTISYNKTAELFKNLGTTIEDMTVGFLKYCVIPKNLPLLKAYLGIENAPAEAGAQMELHHRIFKQVFDIATKNTG